LPSLNSRNHHQRFKNPTPPVEAFDGTKLVPAMHEVLKLCAKHDLVLETCHLAPQEAIALIKEARAAGVQKIVCTHADYDPINMSIDEQREAARLGAFIEHAYIGVYLGPQSSVPRFQSWRGASVEQMAAAIKAVGADHLIVGNMPGAGSLLAANHLFRVAKPDGLTLAHFNGVLFLGQVLGQPGIEFDSRRFELIGAALKEDVVCAMTKASGITSLEKWMAATTPVKLGGVAPGAAPDNTARILK